MLPSAQPAMSVSASSPSARLVKKDVGAVDAEDIAPSSGPHETDVWLTEWQVTEDGFDVALDQRVDWTLVPMDQEWVTRLFSGRRTFPLPARHLRPNNADTRETSWTGLSFPVACLESISFISVRYQPSEDPAEDGLVPETGGAVQHSVPSLQRPRAHHGEIVGWIVRVRGVRLRCAHRPVGPAPGRRGARRLASHGFRDTEAAAEDSGHLPGVDISET